MPSLLRRGGRRARRLASSFKVLGRRIKWTLFPHYTERSGLSDEIRNLPKHEVSKRSLKVKYNRKNIYPREKEESGGSAQESVAPEITPLMTSKMVDNKPYCGPDPIAPNHIHSEKQPPHFPGSKWPKTETDELESSSELTSFSPHKPSHSFGAKAKSKSGLQELLQLKEDSEAGSLASWSRPRRSYPNASRRYLFDYHESDDEKLKDEKIVSSEPIVNRDDLIESEGSNQKGRRDHFNIAKEKDPATAKKASYPQAQNLFDILRKKFEFGSVK